MASVGVSESEVVVRLSALERVAAWRRTISVRRDAIAGCEVVDRPLAHLRGIRAPGTGITGLIAYGTFRHRGGKDFVVARRGTRAVRIDLRGHEFASLLISVSDAADICAQIAH